MYTLDYVNGIASSTASAGLPLSISKYMYLSSTRTSDTPSDGPAGSHCDLASVLTSRTTPHSPYLHILSPVSLHATMWRWCPPPVCLTCLGVSLGRHLAVVLGRSGKWGQCPATALLGMTVLGLAFQFPPSLVNLMHAAWEHSCWACKYHGH